MSDLSHIPPHLLSQLERPVIVSPLALVQQRFCLANFSGKFYVVDRQQVADTLAGSGPGVQFYDKDGGKLAIERFIATLPVDSAAPALINQFRVSSKTHVYDEVAFDPRPTPATTLNYWVGPTAAAAPGNCTLILDYLREVVCDDDRLLYDYLIKFLAHMLQKPEEKPEIFIVLLGGQGTGKGTFFHLLQAIWGRTTLQVSDVDDVVGRFNACIERNYIIWMDEALFVGDGKAIDRMKSMVTEPTINIEQKYEPGRTIRSFHRFFAASNNDHFSRIDADDRRHLFLRVSSRYQNNQRYFGRVLAALRDPSQIGAFVNHLEQVDLSGFNVRMRPTTTEHARQKLRSLTGFARYWFDLLAAGRLPAYAMVPDADAEWTDPTFVATQTLIDGYGHYNKRANTFKQYTRFDLSSDMKRLCPSAEKDRKQADEQRGRGYELPRLADARRAFEAFLGCPVPWGEDLSDAGERKQAQQQMALAELEALWHGLMVPIAQPADEAPEEEAARAPKPTPEAAVAEGAQCMTGVSAAPS